MQHRNRITHVRRSTYDGVDTHVAHCTYHHDILNIESIQLLLEVSVSEGVDMFFNNHRLFTLRSYRRLNVRAAGSLDENGGSRIIGFVPYVKNGNTCMSRMVDDPAGIRHCRLDAAQRQLASGQVFVLQINYYKTLFHERSPIKSK